MRIKLRIKLRIKWRIKLRIKPWYPLKRISKKIFFNLLLLYIVWKAKKYLGGGNASHILSTFKYNDVCWGKHV